MCVGYFNILDFVVVICSECYCLIDLGVVDIMYFGVVFNFLSMFVGLY